MYNALVTCSSATTQHITTTPSGSHGMLLWCSTSRVRCAKGQYFMLKRRTVSFASGGNGSPVILV